MDNMETMTVGIDDELEQENSVPTIDAEEKVIKMRRPYVTWTVGEEEYRLKLTSSTITQLERRFNKSLLDAVLEDGIPPVSVVITLIQASMQKFHHGMKSYTVETIFDRYIDAGGSQISLLTEVIYPLMYDAGFFTDGQMELLTKEIGEADSNL